MATANFLQAWRAGHGTLSVLAKITLPRADGSQTDTLYASWGDTATPADSSTGAPERLWADLIVEVDPIHMPGAFASTDLAICTGGVELHADRVVTFPGTTGLTVTTTLRQSLSSHVWTGGRVSLYRWLGSLADFADAQCILKDAAVVSWEVEGAVLSIRLRQGMEWNKPIVVRTVTRQEFPHAPDEAVGGTLPIVYGNLGAARMRRPWPKATTFQTNHRYYRILNARGGVGNRYAPALMVDTGRGGAAASPEAKVIVAGHAIDSVFDDAKGTSVWMDMGDNNMALVSGTVFNAATGAGMKIPDSIDTAYLGLLPHDIRLTDANGTTITSLAVNLRNILDPSDSTYVWFDKAAGYAELWPMFPDAPETVRPVSFDLVVGYQSDASLAGFGIWQHSVTLNLIQSLGPATTPTIVTLNVSGMNWSTYRISNQFYSLRFGGGAGTARVFFFGIVLRCGPKRDILNSERLIGSQNIAAAERRTRTSIMKPFAEPISVPAVTEMRGKFYSNPRGVLDDGAGTYTGTANALIERAPDLMQHLLVTYGSVPLANIERGAGVGSFEAERTQLAVPENVPLQQALHALCIVESVDVLTALLWLTGDSLSMVHVSPYTGKFKLHVWNAGRPVDYTYTFSKDDLLEPLGPLVEQTPLPDVVTGVRVAYGHDSKDGTKRSEATVGAARSVSGYDTWGLRDQSMVVVSNKNNFLDFTSEWSEGGAFNLHIAALTAGIYKPQSDLTIAAGGYIDGFAQQLKDQLRWAEMGSAGNSRYQVTWGTKITTGYNDRLTFKRNGANLTVTMPANDGTLTCEQLADAAKIAINTALGNWPPGAGWLSAFDVTYNRSTNLYKFRPADGATWLRLVGGDGADYNNARIQYTAWTTFGFKMGGTDPSLMAVGGVESDDIRIEEHFAIASLGGSGATPQPKFRFNLLLKTGSTGADSTTPWNCGEVLGFRPEDRTYVYETNGGYSYQGDCAKNTMEHEMATAVGLYGARRELSYPARTIHDARTAVALRRRISDLMRAPRTVVRFQTTKAPDIERGNVIGFSADMDGVASFPSTGSNGSWADKQFVVTEVVHNLGPTMLASSITAVEIGRLAAVAVAIGLAVVIGNVAMRVA